jgi:hypothetical protein
VFTAYLPAAVAEPEEPLILSEELPSVPDRKQRTPASELESKMDALFGPGFASAADPEPELIDVEDLLADDESRTAAPAAETLGDEMQFDLDLGLSLEEDALGKRRPPESALDLGGDLPDIDFKLDLDSSVEAAEGDNLASLEELGINLEELEAEAETEAADSPGAAEGADLELDFNLDALGAEDVTERVSEPAEAKFEEDLAAAGPSAISGAADVPLEEQPAGESELDLSDLENMLDSELQGLEAKTFAAVEGVELEMGPGAAAPLEHETIRDGEEPDLTPSAAATVPAADSGELAEAPRTEIDLAADLANAAEDATVPAAPPELADDALDLSDITSILEETPAAPPAEGVAEIAPEIDLVLDDDQPAAGVVQAPLTAEAPDDLMLDIETLLEEGEKTQVLAEQRPAEAAMEIDRDLFAEPAPAADEDLEIEIEPAEEAEAPATLEAAGQVAAAVTHEPEALAEHLATEEFGSADRAGATNVIELAPAVAAAAEAAAAPRRSRVSKLLVAVLGVLVLAVAAVVIPRSLDIEVPFLSDLEIPLVGKIFQTQPPDPAGNLKMAPLAENLTAEFIDNAGVGRLCVIRGVVRNNYDHPRSAIRVTAKLYTKDKALAKTTTVFAGNLLSNPELATLDLAAIDARLKNKEGTNKSNVGVKPGRTLPFMTVFDQLPNNLDEYSVEVAGSTP